MLIGFFMILVGGIVMPYLMLPEVGVIPLDRLNVALGFIIPIFSYGLSVTGLFLGIVGAAMYVRRKRPLQHSSDHEKRSGPFSQS